MSMSGEAPQERSPINEYGQPDCSTRAGLLIFLAQKFPNLTPKEAAQEILDGLGFVHSILRLDQPATTPREFDIDELLPKPPETL